MNDKIRANITLINFVDKKNAENHLIPQCNVRSVSVNMVIDSEATLPVIGEDIAEALGIIKDEEILGWHSNGYDNIEPCSKGYGIFLKYGDRMSLTNCVILERGTEPLLGQIPLEEMDLLVDSMSQKLIINPVSPNGKPIVSL
ncbi:MAG: hypothetical protein NT007_11710 [Candidatus Kapabacteria bacterium]|nr:hypothetical protein [Candidatus Kapabacteria bacterium]